MEGRQQLDRALHTWKAFAAKMEEHRPRVAIDRNFFDYAWREWNLEVALRVLLSDRRDTFFGERSATYAAFCAWIICPLDDKVRRAAIAVAAGKSLSRREKKIRTELGDIGQLGDIYARLAIDSEFFEQIYYPIGGLSAILKYRNGSGVTKTLREASGRALKFLKILQIYHFHSIELSDRDFYRDVSFDASQRLLSKSFHITKSGGRVNIDRKNEFSKSSFFLYAASQTPIESGHSRLGKQESLLDAIIRGKRGFRSHQKYIALLAGKAKHLQQAANFSFEPAPERFEMPGIATIEFSPPFSEQEKEAVAAAYRKKTVRR